MTQSHPSVEDNIPDPADSDVETTAQESAEVTGEVKTDQPVADADEVVADNAEATEEKSALEAQQERYLRLAAEYDNYRKRTARELQQAITRGQGDVIKGLLESLDDLARVAHINPESTDANSVLQGIALVERNIMKALEAHGLEVIDPVDLPFDPNLHEALSTQAAESPEEDNIVSQVYQRGYMLKGSLLRPARVVVKQYQ
jgi:molecular chaperone GrpE